MAQNPHEYLIEQLQFTGDESIGSSSNKIKLNFNHPCKELVWVVQPDANVSYCDSFVGGKVLNTALGAQPFNYTDAIDALPNPSVLTSQLTNGNAGVISNGLFKDAGVIDVDGLFQSEPPTEAFVLPPSWGENPVSSTDPIAADAFQTHWFGRTAWPEEHQPTPDFPVYK